MDKEFDKLVLIMGSLGIVALSLTLLGSYLDNQTKIEVAKINSRDYCHLVERFK